MPTIQQYYQKLAAGDLYHSLPSASEATDYLAALQAARDERARQLRLLDELIAICAQHSINAAVEEQARVQLETLFPGLPDDSPTTTDSINLSQIRAEAIHQRVYLGIVYAKKSEGALLVKARREFSVWASSASSAEHQDTVSNCKHFFGEPPTGSELALKVGPEKLSMALFRIVGSSVLLNDLDDRPDTAPSPASMAVVASPPPPLVVSPPAIAVVGSDTDTSVATPVAGASDDTGAPFAVETVSAIVIPSRNHPPPPPPLPPLPSPPSQDRIEPLIQQRIADLEEIASQVASFEGMGDVDLMSNSRIIDGLIATNGRTALPSKIGGLVNAVQLFHSQVDDVERRAALAHYTDRASALAQSIQTSYAALSSRLSLLRSSESALPDLAPAAAVDLSGARESTPLTVDGVSVGGPLNINSAPKVSFRAPGLASMAADESESNEYNMSFLPLLGYLSQGDAGSDDDRLTKIDAILEGIEAALNLPNLPLKALRHLESFVGVQHDSFSDLKSLPLLASNPLIPIIQGRLLAIDTKIDTYKTKTLPGEVTRILAELMALKKGSPDAPRLVRELQEKLACDMTLRDEELTKWNETKQIAWKEANTILGRLNPELPKQMVEELERQHQNIREHITRFVDMKKEGGLRGASFLQIQQAIVTPDLSRLRLELDALYYQSVGARKLNDSFKSDWSKANSLLIDLAGHRFQLACTEMRRVNADAFISPEEKIKVLRSLYEIVDRTTVEVSMWNMKGHSLNMSHFGETRIEMYKILQKQQGVSIDADNIRESIEQCREKLQLVASESNTIVRQAMCREVKELYTAICTKVAGGNLLEEFHADIESLKTAVASLSKPDEPLVATPSPPLPPATPNAYLYAESKGTLTTELPFTTEVIDKGNVKSGLSTTTPVVVKSKSELELGMEVNHPVTYQGAVLTEQELIRSSAYFVANNKHGVLTQDSKGHVLDHSDDGLSGPQSALMAFQQAKMLLENYDKKYGDIIIKGTDETQAKRVYAAVLFLIEGQTAFKNVKIQSYVCKGPDYGSAGLFQKSAVRKAYIKSHLSDDLDKILAPALQLRVKQQVGEAAAQFAKARATGSHFKTEASKLRSIAIDSAPISKGPGK